MFNLNQMTENWRSRMQTAASYETQFDVVHYTGMALSNTVRTHELTLKRGMHVSFIARCEDVAGNLPYFFVYDPKGKRVAYGIHIPNSTLVSGWHSTGVTHFTAHADGTYWIEVQQNHEDGCGIYMLECQIVEPAYA